MKQPSEVVVRPNAAEAALGDVLEKAIQLWVRTGRKVHVEDAPWLRGPIGDETIGAGFYENYAREAGLRIVRDDSEAGLLPDFEVLAGSGFDPGAVRPEVRRFYERTAGYELTLSYAWSGPLRNPPRTLIYLVSRNIRQVNLPISPLAADVRISNEVIRLSGPATKDAPRDAPFTGWLRRLATTGEEILAGFYGACELPGREGKFVRGFYPLPNGSATVVFRPENRPDGSFALVSDGRRFGEEGYYRTHRVNADDVRYDGARRVRCVPMEEVVHVFVDEEGALRARHTFASMGFRFLTLWYGIRPRNRE